jgi:hypothetical protein
MDSYQIAGDLELVCYHFIVLMFPEIVGIVIVIVVGFMMIRDKARALQLLNYGVYLLLSGLMCFLILRGL